MTDLRNALTVVTGGGMGVGLGLALEAARRGSRVVIASISDAGAAVEQLRAAGAEADWFQVDVSIRERVQELAAFTREKYGPVNVLINNAAGGDSAGSIIDNDPEGIQRALNINVLGYVWTIQAFADDLRSNAAKGAPAYILNVGSEHSLGVPPHVMPLSAYTVTKQAGLAVTEVVRRDLAGTGIGVSLVAPGWVLTEQVSGMISASEEFAAVVTPYAQETSEVARIAFDGLLSGRELIVTNPKSVPFAKDRAHRILGDLSWAEHREEAAEGWVHDGTGDISKCPVVHTPGLS
ncbi:SDR family NAD(P)-dependent oxidoreductase [Streptomyces sp. UG1]|uniref:SDR family NAD(P)-dependent oxidoreductase n=1 Tax=Streptomyces sp. UG1 TaxID=3417652 RepID=UPI003CF526A0